MIGTFFLKYLPKRFIYGIWGQMLAFRLDELINFHRFVFFDL